LTFDNLLLLSFEFEALILLLLVRAGVKKGRRRQFFFLLMKIENGGSLGCIRNEWF
jgi:hypothetical protein